jgi:hypothetical protein
MLTVAPDPKLLAGVILIELPASEQDRIMRYNQSETEQKIRFIDGFVGAAFMKSPDGKMVAEYVQRRNAEKYRAAYQTRRSWNIFRSLPRSRILIRPSSTWPRLARAAHRATPRSSSRRAPSQIRS